MSGAEKNDAIENVNYLNSIQECLKTNFAVIEFTTNGEIVTANENFLATVGYNLPELKGKHHRIFVSNEYANSDDYHNFWQRIAAGESFKGEFERFGKNNKRVWLDAVYAPIKDATGKVTGAFKIASDITQIKEMAKLKQMVDLAPINMMLADPKGKMTYMNDASRRTLKSLEKLLPASVEQLVGNSVDWFHKNPEHNRAIFSNPNKLPHKKIIQLGPEKLELLVSPVFDHNQVFVGPMVSWEVVTERVKLVEELTNTSEQLASASEELLSVAQTMSSSAEETAAQASTASSASEQISAGIQSVATNMEEMTASIREITKNTNSASTQSSSALDKSTAANKIIEVLGESSNDIGNIIKVITSIAQQTNLLALNATIEAARAGEAGKGFAVVANEVKELAKQTANATEDISKKIEAIQNDSQSAVGSIGSVSEAMEQLNGIASSIASAMEEQAATTNEVSRVVTEATTGVNQITQTIQQVNVAAEQTGRGAADMTQSANDLNKIAQNLNQLIERFKVEE